VLTIFAGPNGSGKSTLTRQIRTRGYHFGTYINADDIASQMLTDAVARGESATRSDFEVAAFWEAERRRQTCIDQNADFAFETVFSHPSKIELIRRAKAAGFVVRLYFVTTESVLLNIARVRKRVAEGGHAVPEDKVITRYRRTMGHLAPACMEVDEAFLFDNSGSTMRAVAYMAWKRGEASIQMNEPLPGWLVAWGREIEALLAMVRTRH